MFEFNSEDNTVLALGLEIKHQPYIPGKISGHKKFWINPIISLGKKR